MFFLSLLVLPVLGDIPVFGYLPDYRTTNLVEQARELRREGCTHVIYFSIEVGADGGLAELHRLPASLGEAGVMVAVGGQGRSEHFAAALAAERTRKRLAKKLAKLCDMCGGRSPPESGGGAVAVVVDANTAKEACLLHPLVGAPLPPQLTAEAAPAWRWLQGWLVRLSARR